MKEKESFLDKNTLIAVALVFVAWLGWDSYMRKKYPQQKPPLSFKENPRPQTKEVAEPLVAKKLKINEKEEPPLPTPDQTLSFKSENLSFDLSSKGMGFKKVVLNRILDRKGEAVYLFSGHRDQPFETRLIHSSKPLFFNIQQVSKNQFSGTAEYKGAKIQKTLTVFSEKFLIKTQVKVTGDLSAISGISSVLNQTEQAEDKKGWLAHLFMPPDFLSFFLSSAKGFEHIPLSSKEPDKVKELISEKSKTSIHTVALGQRYFGQAWIEDNSDVLPQFQIRFQKAKSDEHPPQKQESAGEKGRYSGEIQHFILNHKKDFELSYKIFMGPKDFKFLDGSLLQWADFGYFGPLARFILKILKFFHSLTGNWGLAIILLTILVRLLLLPFVLSSHRSMEVMKKINPEIQKIRTKFKKDPQRMNQEIMAMMKNHKANPLGGCLPLLLQIPVFWALWKALSNSYSLYRAPFGFWIQDLSWKDPYYVLPLLMGLLMFFQQKISPVTMNREMARALQIMPIFITFFMINLPSGLVLYMLISTLFGLGQQVYLNKTGDKAGKPS